MITSTDRDVRVAWRKPLLWAVASALVCAVILTAIPAVFGLPRAIVRITWRDVTAADRVQLERRFGLSAAVRVDDAVWAYEPTDLSRETFQAIVTHPNIAATVGINRQRFRMAASPPLSPRRGGLIAAAPAWLPRATRLLAYLFGLAAFVLLGRAALASRLVPEDSIIRGALASLASDPMATLRALPIHAYAWVLRRIPVASADAAGLFRIAFTAAVVLLVTTNPAVQQSLQTAAVDDARGLYGVTVRWLRANPAVASSVYWWLLATGIALTAGIATRAASVCFTLGYLLWASMFTLETSTHAVAIVGVTLIGLSATRWGDGLSVDAWLRRRYGGTRMLPPGPAYGFAFWFPRLVIALAFLAAAMSKLRGGLDWILNGTVKYYFVSDLQHALVGWGPGLTRHHWMAVVISGAAVGVEALLITAVFSRSEPYQLMLAAASLTLLAGFAVFQGVLWWGWWILLLAFLPWHRFAHVNLVTHGGNENIARPLATRLTHAQAVAIVAVIVQQLVVSLLHVEARPLLSAYDMYSATYASAEEFEDARNLVYRVVLYEGDRPRDLPGCFVDDRSAPLLLSAGDGTGDARARLRGVIRECDAIPASATAVALEGDREVYDWESGRFEWKRRLDVVGPVPADWIRQ